MKYDFENFYKKGKPLRAFVKKRLIGIAYDKTVKEAARRMVEFNISSITVIKREKVIGFFTEENLKKFVAEGRKPNTPINQVMVTDLITVDVSIDIRKALEAMVDKNIKHLLVEEKGKIIGVVTFKDFLDFNRQKIETFIARE